MKSTLLVLGLCGVLVLLAPLVCDPITEQDRFRPHPVTTVVAAYMQAEAADKSIAHVMEKDCFIGLGDQLVLCEVYHHGDSVILEFERGVSSIYFDLAGPEAKVEYWTIRDDIGDLSRAVVRAPDEGDRPVDPCELWGIGIGQIPPIVAVRLTGRISTIEDIVYAHR